MEEQHWEKWDAQTLRAYYEQQQQDIANKLLQGYSWEEVSEQRAKITQLSIHLYRAISAHPAAYSQREL
jgi:hypothetical protein